VPVSVAAILLSAVAVYAVLRFAVLRILTGVAERWKAQWYSAFLARGVFKRLIAVAPGVVVYWLAALWLTPVSPAAFALRILAQFWMMLFGLLSFYSVLDAVVDIYNTLPFARQLPIRSFVQVVKIVVFVVFGIVSISLLLGKSPTLLISGMGAMTAVLMLVFKDPILGFVAGIHLSANRMLAVGDWLEMPKYNADGDVIDITLTTVKVQNWDKTITTIPTYALISDSFKNWRGMTETGGRRIKRSMFIDMTSIRFLNQDDIERLSKAQLLTDYIRNKIEEIERHNREHCIDPSSPANGRRLTNIGTFRAYLLAYLKQHPGIHQNLLMIVRQLQPTPEGLPMEIYAFTSDTAWVAYEGVQSDIFDHILAVIVYQMPSGNDLCTLKLRQEQAD